MKVTFDSEIYLDEIFRRAVKLAAANRRKPFKLYSYLSDRKSKLSVGIDIQTYGPYNARMALLTTNEANPKEIDLERIEMFDDHVGNLKYDESFTSEQLEFVKEFKYLLGKCLECFGKRWNELRKDRELAMSKSVEFKLVEKDQFPFVYYDESRVYSVNSIMQRFFRAMFECLSIDTMCTAHLAHLKNVCVTVPSDYHTYQRLLLKNCLRSIGIESCIFVNKPTSLALPFLAKDLNDRTQKFVIDFSSGYMNCSIIQLIDTNRLLVQDQLSDKTISSRDFYLDCYKHLEQSSNKRHSNDKLYDPLKLNHELYKVMNEETNPRWNQTKEVWTVRCSKSTTVDLNMKRVGIEQFTSSVVNKLRRTRLIDVNDHIVDEIDDIFICSDAVVYEYLEPLLTRLSRANSKRSVRFMDNDCACLGAAYLASDLLGISTSDMLPYHIGVGLYNGLVKHIIPAKANFPCEDTHIFQTIIDNQTTIRANIYEGKSVLARNSKHICELAIEGLRAAPSGQVRIELKIYIDQNGVLSALACDYTTKKALRVSIDPNETEYLKFKRDHSLLVDLDQRIDSSSSLQANIIKYLEDFDYYFEYLTHLYGNSPYELRSKVTSRINAAKKYISRNRFRIGLDECEKLKSELDGVVLTNRAINPNDYSSSSSNGYSRASSVRRRSSDCILS